MIYLQMCLISIPSTSGVERLSLLRFTSPKTERHPRRASEQAARRHCSFSDLLSPAQPMPACGKIVITASLLACHSASALRMGSIGTRLAHVDPAVWTAAAGVAATTRLQREAVSKAAAADKYLDINAFDRNMKALGTVARSMQQYAYRGALSECFALGVGVRVLFELFHLLATHDDPNTAASFSGDHPLWPKVTRLFAVAAASVSTMGVYPGLGAAVCLIGFLGSGRLI